MIRSWRRSLSAPRLESLEARTMLTYGPMPWSPLTPTPDNTVLVRFQAGAPAARVQAAINSVGLHVARTFPDGPMQLVLRPNITPEAAARTLSANRFVVYAEPDRVFSPLLAMPNDPRYGSQWGLNQSNDVDIDAPQAWDITVGRPSTIVAVTDTGVDYTHPDLYLNIVLNQGEIPAALRSALVDTNGDGQIDFYDLNSLNAGGGVVRNAAGAAINAWATRDLNGNGRIDAGDLFADPAWCDGVDNDGNGYADDFAGWNFVTNTNNPWDGYSHGTHVSGTIAATTNNAVGVAGVNWNARILPMKWLSDSGAGSASGAASSIYYAAQFGARVINASWSGGSTSIRDAIAHAGTKNAVFVASAGNESSNNDVNARPPSTYDLPNILSVAALMPSGALASFSNYGATTVDVGAPGSGVLSTLPNGGYGNKSGTSMAAPHVAGVVSLIVGMHPEYTATQIRALIIATVKPLASLAGKTVSGGMVSVWRALNGTPPGTDPPPPSPAPTPPAPSLLAPTNLKAASLSDSQIQLTWTGAAGALGYRIERSLDGKTGWTTIARLGAGATSHLDTSLAESTNYSYRMVAVQAEGESAYTSVVSARTKKIVTKGK